MDSHRITVVGEGHAEESARLAIASQLPLLREKKGALVAEHLYANRQAMLNEWLQSPPNTQMPPVLNSYLDFLDKSFAGRSNDGSYYGLKQLVTDAGIQGSSVEPSAASFIEGKRSDEQLWTEASRSSPADTRLRQS